MPNRQLILLLSILSSVFPLVAAVDYGVIQPNGAVLTPFQQQQFTLPGYGPNIVWSIQPAGMGSISETGLYTAPNSTGVAFVYAQPVGSTTSFASVIYLSQATLAGLTPGTTTVGTGSTGTGSTVLPYPGTAAPLPAPVPTSSTPQPLPSAPSLSPSPLQPVYPGSPTQGNPTGGVSISVSPASITLQAGQSAWFNTIVQGTNPQVQWTLNPN